MTIWAWVLEVYDRPGVPAATLALQDAHGQNTSYLLWAVHAGVTDRALLAGAADVARAWDRTALVPIRQVRRDLKANLPSFQDTAREAFRESVKAMELAAERLLLETLEGLSPRRMDVTPLEALTAAVEVWGEPAPAQVLGDLARALG